MDNIELINNNDYGSPELKKSYQIFFSRGLFVAIVIHLFLIGVYLGIMYVNKTKAEEQNKSVPRIFVLTDLEVPPPADEKEQPTPKPEEILQQPPKDMSALAPEPVAKKDADTIRLKTQNELEKITSQIGGGDSGKFTYSGNAKLEDTKVEVKLQKDEHGKVEQTVFQSFEVEKPPECVNLGQVWSSMTYPPVALDAGIEGRVTVKVLVGQDGNVIKVASASGPDVFYDEVKDKSINLQFTPGLQNGKPVKVWVTVPFIFKLSN